VFWAKESRRKSWAGHLKGIRPTGGRRFLRRIRSAMEQRFRPIIVQRQHESEGSGQKQRRRG